MKTKILITVISLGILIFVLVVNLKTRNYCEKDTDCKLIYSSCDCEAVNINDIRHHSIGDSPTCFVNSCKMLNIQAVCIKNRCVKSLPRK